MSFAVLRALNPFATRTGIAASRQAARTGGFAGLILTALSAWDVLALHLGREEFLGAYAASLPVHAHPAVIGAVQSMGSTFLAMAIGFQLILAAVLAVAALIQFRRVGRLPLALFAAVALFDLWRLGSALVHGVPSAEITWPLIRGLLNLLALSWTVAAFRNAFHSRDAPFKAS